jgi:hypothetical protein
VVQAKLCKTLGLNYSPLPPELIDAFSHDPSVVTGATRQKRGWQAVEDIHTNIARQRNTVREFLEQARHVEVAPPRSVLDSPLKSLQQSLDALEQRRGMISQKVQEVIETLTRVKQEHAVVKTEYNNTMSHTSSVYPEVRPFGVALGHVLNKHLAFRNHRLGGEIQGPVPTAVGIRHGCTYHSPGFGYTILEELWKGHWRGCSRLSDHPLVPKRIHRRGGEVCNQSSSSAVLPALGRPRPLFLHHTRLSHPADPGSALVFVTIPPTV